jgi:predicted transcriptional regulator
MKLDSHKADLLFIALGNKTRRRMLQRLAEKPARSISELAKEFSISNTATSNQIAILEKTNLITRTKHGRYQKITICNPKIKAVNAMLNEIIRKNS